MTQIKNADLLQKTPEELRTELESLRLTRKKGFTRVEKKPRKIRDSVPDALKDVDESMAAFVLEALKKKGLL